jgi:hypothetical protein
MSTVEMPAPEVASRTVAVGNDSLAPEPDSGPLYPLQSTEFNTVEDLLSAVNAVAEDIGFGVVRRRACGRNKDTGKYTLGVMTSSASVQKAIPSMIPGSGNEGNAVLTVPGKLSQ